LVLAGVTASSLRGLEKTRKLGFGGFGIVSYLG
jgi:hypothetical protein